MRWLIVVLLLLLPQSAWALCVGTTLSGVPGSKTFSGAGGEFNTYDATEYMQTFTFDVNSTASIGGCKYFMVVTPGTSGNASQRKMARGSDRLNYNVYTNGAKNIWQSTGNYNGGGVLSGTFPQTNILQSNQHTFYWTIAPLPSTAVSYSASRFDDSVTIQLWAELALGIYTLNSSATVTLQARAESIVELSLVDTGAGFSGNDNAQTLDFMDLTSGESLSYDTLIRSNAGYTVKFQSANGQTLQHLVNGGYKIPYSMTFGGGSVNLMSGNQVTAATSPSVTSAGGDRYATQFTIGTLSGAEATGNYRDIITVTLSSN